MDASVVGIRLASGVVAPLVKKLFRGEGAGAGLVDRPVRISSYVSLREQRVLSRYDLGRLADKLVAEALRAPGEQPLPAGEEAGVAAALAATLYSLGALALEDAQAVEMGATAFAAALRRAAPATGLGRDAELFHDRLLETTCLHILHFFTTRSTYIPAALVEQARRQAELIAKIDVLLARIPRQDARDTEFERKYLAYLATRHNTLTIFGLDLAPGSARWPLDLAYVSLEATPRPRRAGGGDSGPIPAAPIPAQDPSHGPAPVRTEDVLASETRVLLRGEAGSGKTTLIQWLAVSTARNEPEGGSVPFVLPLRSLSRYAERLPAPEDFLVATGLKGRSPEGWESRVMDAGRGLILVDGIDEIPEGERERARDWLTDLLTAYPGNRWLVTSRPSAVRQDWLATEQFAELTLAPMNRADVAGFVTRWHRAAEAGAELRDQLLASLSTKPELARLATNPLLCGLICALHRERHGFLPSGRKELYTAALSMLLHRRDRERDLRLPELAEEPQLQLLQRLAYWLIRNGRTQISWKRAEDLIAAALPAVPAAQVLGDAPAVLRHFLERTGLLRAPTEDTLEFVHRTFQDFLGARAGLDEGGLGELTRHADDDQWEDVIRMAVAQGRPHDRAAIIGDLLVRDSDRSVLLALASLEYAAELDPGLRQDVHKAALRLIPPKNEEAARALGRIGPLVLELLPSDGKTVRVSHLSVIAAVETGAEAAVGYLAGYCHHPSERIRATLTQVWERFDLEHYAAEVLARMVPPPGDLSITRDAQLAALTGLAGPPGLHVHQRVSRDALTRFLARQPVAGLGLLHFAGGTDAEFLRGQTSLRWLDFRGWPELRDLSALHGLPLEEVILELGNDVPLGPALAAWPRLRTFTLLPGHGPWSFADFSPEARLEVVDVDDAAPDLAGLGRHTSLRSLWLGDTWRPRGEAAWAELSALENLEEIAVHTAALAGLASYAHLPSLRTIMIHEDQASNSALRSQVAHSFPQAALKPVTEAFDAYEA
ncbi:NACHT domain-containing protein [Streptomyces sp. NBC_01264]|uniref:NACHT domain-containing protein n=1 Tax=Streptomyces sp. NBC_01264 TaxID=2903804 RepID=UPI00225A2847|nr:NACHT domain-containing protein [Streptomyces sp. NBC_01264]MCX4780200.1 NACHT domain-containing protein [Streptomyces sp. NBC_01264]